MWSLFLEFLLDSELPTKFIDSSEFWIVQLERFCERSEEQWFRITLTFTLRFKSFYIKGFIIKNDWLDLDLVK